MTEKSKKQIIQIKSKKRIQQKKWEIMDCKNKIKQKYTRSRGKKKRDRQKDK